MTCTKKPGRPAGDKRQALSLFVAAHPSFTMGQLLRGLGWSMRDADNHLRLALRRGQLQVVDRVAQPGCKRRVAVYAPAHALGCQPLTDTISSWAR